MGRSDDRGVEVFRTSQQGMIASLVPEAACAELFSDAPEAVLFPSEAAVVARAATERRREFGTVRHCAREALRAIGMPSGPILPDADGAPRWPAGVVGSMTHCAGYRAAAVARSDEVRSVGIDAEPHAALPGEVRDFVLRKDERVPAGDLHWDRIAFCAKEAVYKAWFPLTRRWLEFRDVATAVHPDGTFLARVADTGFSGRWLVDRGLVVAAASVTR
jgi:4'-phosphopantetheinyl transferase EntD